jgi:chromosome segregation ATPase
MVGKKSVIETGVDKLVNVISQYKKISVKQAAKELGVSASSVEEWADFLEEEGIISIQSHFATVYLVEKKISKRELTEKVKAVKDEKEQFMRRVESSINALERDSEEIKLIDSEFKRIKELLEDNFDKLSGKLSKLEDFRKSHRDIESRRKELEDEYEKKVDQVEDKLKKEHKEYEGVIADIEEELQKIREERKKVEQLKGAEKDLKSKVGDINSMIESIRKEIDKENEQLDVDEERLKKSEETAKSIKEEVQSHSKELDEVAAKVRDARKEIEKMEKDFVKDLESLSKGDLDRIGPYKESKRLIEKFKKFFSETKEIEGLIHKAEREEEEIRDHFKNLAKKVTAFSVVTSVPEIKKEMAGLHKELVEIESRKDVLASQLRRLRSVVRAVIK